MIELTNVAYFTLIGLSVLAGYALHGIVIAIKKGEFFDQEANKMEDEPSLEYDTGGRWQCDECELVFEVYGMQDVDDVKRCPVCGSGKVWIIEEMMI